MNEYPYWWDTLPSRTLGSENSELRTENSAPATSHQPPATGRVDVAIIGAGYTGLAAARLLAKSGASVAVLERERVGWGASSRNGGQLLTGLKLDPSTLIKKHGEARARQLFDVAKESIARLESLVAQETIDCELTRTGHLQAACKPSHFAAFRDEQALLARVFNHRVELVSRADQRSEVGTDGYHGLMIDEHSGAINPARYVHGLAAAAVRAGASIATGVAVTGVQRASNGWRVSTADGAISARNVFAATNGYTGGATPNLQRRFVPIGSYIIATEPLTPDRAAAILPKKRMAFDSKNFLHYFRVTPDRRLVFGGRAEFTSPDENTTRRAAAILQRAMTDLFPELAGTRIDYAWGGNVAFTRDQMPHAGVIDGVFYAGGYCGHGIAMATHLGEAIADRISGGSAVHPLFDDRFPAIPFYDGRPWFLPLVGAYYRLMDLIS
ncbi:MAG: FAD-binding oxidoreductase [Acidobacteriia bacterium]|nr:FAD-binding oxidoreductase [Terriglobia bacterium]